MRDRANFVARQHVIEHVMLLQPINKLRQQARFLCRFGVSGGSIEKPFGVFRVVQVIPEPPFVVFIKKIQLLLRGVDLRSHLFEFEFLVLQPHLDVAQRSFQIRGIRGSSEIC